MRFLVPLWALLLAACGDGSIQSPDFTAVLKGLTVEELVTHATTVNAPVGSTVQLQALGQYSTPPGSSSPTTTSPTSAEWASSTPSVATVDGNGLVTAVSVGSAVIAATKGGFTGQATVNVGAAQVVTLTIARSSDASQTSLTADTLARGTQRSYTAVGVYTDGVKRPIPADWSSSAEDTVRPGLPLGTTPVKNLSAPSSAASGDAAVITAVAEGPNSTLISATMTITVSGAELIGNLSVVLDPASPIPINSGTEAFAYGSYSDGSTQAINDDLINWDSTIPAVATIDKPTGKIATLIQGSTDIVATLKPGAEPQVANRSASTPLLVTGAACTGPFVAPAATVSSNSSGLCIGCNVTDTEFLVDNNDATYAQANLTVGLLAGSVTVEVTSPKTFPGGNNTNAGFIVGRPAGMLLSAELLSQITLTTLFGNDVADTTSVSENPLGVDLLGFTLLGNSETALVSIASAKPFNTIRLTYNAGLLTALSSLKIYNACGTAIPPAPAP